MPAAVEAARAAVDGLRAHPVLRRRTDAVAAESALRGARAAADLQSGETGTGAWRLDDVRAAVRDATLFQPLEGAGSADVDVRAATLRGAVRVSAEIAPLIRTWERAPAQALARLHAVAAVDLLAAGELGRPRGDARPYPGPDRGRTRPGPAGLAPSAAEVAVRLEALTGALTTRTSSPAVVVAAVVHGEILALAPFAWGNVLVALAAQRLVLVARGFDPGALGVPEAGHALLGAAAYTEACDAYVGGGLPGVARWVVHCAEAVALGAREGVAVCAAVQRGS